MKEKRNYTREFKGQACELVLKDGLKVKSVAERMGINHYAVPNHFFTPSICPFFLTSFLCKSSIYYIKGYK